MLFSHYFIFMFANETQRQAYTGPLGPDAIREAAKTISTAPGVYRMMNAAGDVLYVGKAKNLFNRVTSYASTSRLTTRLMNMVNQVARVEVVTTRNEAEALLVEAAQVRRFKPRYNILLKDDKSFPYLLVSNHTYPRIQKHRGAKKEKGEYFGPFASVGALNQTMVLLQRIFLLRPCADSIFKNRSRPCLQYQIKRCSAPCVGYITAEDYAEKITQARDFLHGRHREVQDALQVHMQEASDAMDFETAAFLRDQIRALTKVQQESAMRAHGLEDADVIALARRGSRSVVQVFFYRQGAHFGHQTFHPRAEAEAKDDTVLAAFLAQFYQAHSPPPEILVNLAPEECDLLQEALSLQAESRITIRVPQRGDKQILMTNVATNALAALAREEQQSQAVAEQLTQLQKLFALPYKPERIEVYDNSHIMGRQALGGLIVATPEGFDKRSYRTFNIKDVTTEPGDDYAMMREVFRRRFKHFREKEGSAAAAKLLVLIDGGQGQLSAVQGVMDELQLNDIPLVAVAKGTDRNAGREWFHQTGKLAFQLPPNDPTLHYIQRLRDEAHRFAIGAHRRKRSGTITQSALDDIPGIGPGRKKALLNHFGSRADVERATLDELQKVEGISKTVAQKIHDYFRE